MGCFNIILLTCPLAKLDHLSQTRTRQAKVECQPDAWIKTCPNRVQHDRVTQYMTESEFKSTCAESFFTHWVGKLWLLQWEYTMAFLSYINISTENGKKELPVNLNLRYLQIILKFLNPYWVKIRTCPTLVWPFRRILATCNCKEAGCFRAQEPNWSVS